MSEKLDSALSREDYMMRKLLRDYELAQAQRNLYKWVLVEQNVVGFFDTPEQIAKKYKRPSPKTLVSTSRPREDLIDFGSDSGPVVVPEPKYNVIKKAGESADEC